tara:strand:+ start:855 stop:1163 length:309 start_codon:yes stop_codon:yes gene_type:complete
MNSIVELVKELEKRPAMYLTRNYISCLKAYLDGWYQRDINNVSDINVMDSFQVFIEQKYESGTSHSWCDIILFYSQDETDGLKNFFKEFNDFITVKKADNNG